MGGKRPRVVGERSVDVGGLKYVAKMNVSDLKRTARDSEGRIFEKEKMRGGRRQTGSGRTGHVAI